MQSGSSPPHCNLVLLGQVGAGKSCTGNTILGQRIFHSKKSLNAVTRDIQRASVTVSGLSVDVYDTPGFLGPGVQSGQIERKCQKLLQLNSSVPTVFLLVISTDRFAEQEKKATDLVLSFLGSSNLQNTFIIFTKDDELESNELTIEQYMEDSEELSALVHRLNNQYLVFNNNGDPNNREQAEELIKKIAETNKCISQNQLSPIAQQNHLGTQKKMAEENLMSNLRFNLVMMGRNGVGKSSVGNTILGREAFTTIKSPESVTRAITAEVGSVCGLPITVYDTPGFSGTESEEELWEYEKLLQKCESGLCAFLLVLQPGKITEEDKDAVVKIEEVLGENRINNTWVIFSREDEMVDENMTMDQLLDEDEATRELIMKYEDRFCIFSNCLKERQEKVKKMLSMVIQTSFDRLPNKGPRRIPIIPHLPVSRRLSRRIVLLGKSGVGKSSAGNTILGKKKFKSS